MIERVRRTQGRVGNSLSVSMIVRNEEKFLAGCLESVRDIADEIVVVDTGSTDRTKDIARAYNVRLFEHEWNGDFSAARNYSLQQCQGDWVLYIDADERLADTSRGLLPRLLKNRNADAYVVMIQNAQSMQQTRVHQHNVYPRLFRRSPGVCFEGRVHEQIAPSLHRLNKRILPSDLIIIHHGYDQGYEVVRGKAERNVALLEQQLRSDPNDAYAQFQLGNSLVVLQRYNEAKPILEQAVRNPKLDRSNRASCYNLLAEVAVRSGKLDEAVDYCQTSLQLAPDQLMARWFLSLLFFDMGKYDRALEVLRDLQRRLEQPAIRRTSQIASDLRLEKDEILKRIALTYEASARYGEALAQYVETLGLSPGAADVVGGIERCADKCGDSLMVIDALKRALQRAPGRFELYVPLAAHYRKLNDITAALEYVQRALNALPSNTDLYVMAIRWNMEAGNVAEAVRLCRMSEQNDLRSFELHKVALQAYLAQGDIHSAFRQLELMTQTTEADLTPLRDRLSALAKKLSVSTSAL